MTSEKLYSVTRDLKTHEYTLTAGTGKEKKVTVYVEAYTPNKKQLKELLEHARGEKRTMAQFAELCDVNAPIFSRIMQENDLKRPLKPGIIEALLNYADDKMFVTPANLMRANGLIEKSDEMVEEKTGRVEEKYVEKSDKPSAERLLMPQKRDADWESQKRTIYDYCGRVNRERAVDKLEKRLEERGFEILQSFPNKNSDVFTYGGRIRPLIDNTPNRYDLELDLDHVVEVRDKAGNQFYWGFVIDETEPQGANMDGSFFLDGVDYEIGIDEVDDNVVEKNAKILLRSQIDPESMKNIKISFVCQNRLWYNFAVAALKNVEVENYISVVLIPNGSVHTEYTLRNKKGKRPDCLLGDFCDFNGENYFWYDGLPYTITRISYGEISAPIGYETWV